MKKPLEAVGSIVPGGKLLRLLAQKLVYRVRRVAANDQAFLAWSGLTLLAFLRLFLSHCVILPKSNLVPKPGLGPGRPVAKARECKSRVSAISTTWAPLWGASANAPQPQTLKRDFVGLWVIVGPTFDFQQVPSPAGDENDFTEEAEQRKDPAAVAQRSNASQGSGTSSVNTLCRLCKTAERQAGDVLCGPCRFAQPLVTDRVCPSTQYSGL
jgi:hypothetical protein